MPILLICVADERMSLSLGVQSTVFRLIPSPIVYGDSACIFWQYQCGRRGNCWVYDNTDLSRKSIAIVFTDMVLNLVFCFLTWAFYPRSAKKENPPTGVEISTKRSQYRVSYFTSWRPAGGLICLIWIINEVHVWVKDIYSKYQFCLALIWSSCFVYCFLR